MHAHVTYIYSVQLQQFLYLSLCVHDTDRIALVTDHKLVLDFRQNVYAVDSDISLSSTQRDGLECGCAFSGFSVP